MGKIILTENQLNFIKNNDTLKSKSKPYVINPDKVLRVKRFLDSGFKKGKFDRIGNDGMPESVNIVAMLSPQGQILKNMYSDQLCDLLCDKFQYMFKIQDEREKFMKQVVNDWFDGKIGTFGTLSVNSLNEGTSREKKAEIKKELKKVNTNPSEAQKKVGNYRMGHIRIDGFEITIENPKGSIRKYKDESGKEGRNVMKNHYGYFTRTLGKDGDAVDVFIGPIVKDIENVYVVDQNDKDGNFDESKVMLGFKSKKEAKQAYLSNYSKSWKGFRAITEVPKETFKKWLYRGRKQRIPFTDYKF